MIKQKIQNEIILQGHKQSNVIRGCAKIKGNDSFTPAQLSNYLNKNKSLSIANIEAIFEFLGIELVRIL